MELGFNIAWLILAMALSVGWVRNTSDERFPRSLLALMLLVMLLFPVISITEYIHQYYFNVTGEEVRYKEDLQQRLDFARQHWDAASLHVIVPPTVSASLLFTLVFERTEWAQHSPITQPGFPPTVFDLPPPRLS